MKNLAVWKNLIGVVLAALFCANAPAEEVTGAAPSAAPAVVTAAAAAAPSALPEVQRRNGIDYITGGIGIDESRAIQSEAERWPLLITMAEITRGQSRAVWVANVDVSISTAQDEPVIDFRSGGPLALVRLEAGKYTIRARFNGVEEKRNFAIMAGMSQKLTLIWKSEPR